MGTVICFNDGQDREVLVLDAQYRGTGSMGDEATDYSLPDYQSLNINNNSYIHGIEEETTPTEQATLSDEMINTIWANAIDTNTSKYNCDVVLAETTFTPATAIEHTRSIVVDSTPCDVPNIQILQRIYCEADLLDSMDPTVAEYPDYALGSANLNGAWFVGGAITDTQFQLGGCVWASTDEGYGGNFSYSWSVDCYGVCCEMNCTVRMLVLGVIPVLELT